MPRYWFSGHSLEKMSGLHPDLHLLCWDVMDMQVMDFRVVEGVRTIARQKQLVADGKSKTMESKHLIQADGFGHAVDVYPYPVDMTKVNKGDAREIIRFGVLAGLFYAAAKKRGIIIRWGADWNGDGQTLDHTFFDAPHIEILKGKS